MEIVAALLDDGPDGRVEVGLVKIGGTSAAETFPLARVVFEFGMDPQFGFREAFQRTFVQEIFADHFVLVVLLHEIGLEFVADEGGHHDEPDGKQVMVDVFGSERFAEKHDMCCENIEKDNDYLFFLYNIEIITLYIE